MSPLSREEIILWMDAAASLWPHADYETQKFSDRWWWELWDVLKFEVLEFCPGMWAKNGKRVS